MTTSLLCANAPDNTANADVKKTAARNMFFMEYVQEMDDRASIEAAWQP